MHRPPKLPRTCRCKPGGSGSNGLCRWCHPVAKPRYGSREATQQTRVLARRLVAYVMDLRAWMPWADVNDPGAHFTIGSVLKECVPDESLRDEIARGLGIDV